jgi:hypothetical protein
LITFTVENILLYTLLLTTFFYTLYCWQHSSIHCTADNILLHTVLLTTFFYTSYCWQYWHNSLLWNMTPWEIFHELDFTFTGRNIKLLIFPRPCTKQCYILLWCWTHFGNATQFRHINVFLSSLHAILTPLGYQCTCSICKVQFRSSSVVLFSANWHRGKHRNPADIWSSYWPIITVQQRDTFNI